MNQVDLSQLAIDRAAPVRRKRRHLLTRYVLPMALLAGFAGLVVWASWEQLFPPQSVTVVPVQVLQAQQQPAGTHLFTAAGWIEPQPTPIRVSALAPGVVEKLLVVENQQVSAGEVVALLVKDDAELAHRRAAADLQLREAELTAAQADHTAALTRLEHPVHLEAQLGAAEAKLAGIETLLQNLPYVTRQAAARREFSRQDYEGKSAAPGVIARVQLDQAKSELDANVARLEELQGQQATLGKEQTALQQQRDALRLQLELLIDEIRDRDATAARVVAARARVEQAQVTLHESQLRLDRMTIHAPIDGRLFELVGHPGTTMAGNMQHGGRFDSSTVITLYQPEWLQVRVDVRFEDLPLVQHEQPVQIRNAALPAPLPGKVLLIGSLANMQKNTQETLVVFDQPPEVLKPQMLMDVTFLSPQSKNKPAANQTSTAVRLYVPSQLVQDAGGTPFVWVADQTARVARRIQVELGAVGQSDLVEIRQGLNRTSRLIATGWETLQDGSRISVLGEAPATNPATRAR